MAPSGGVMKATAYPLGVEASIASMTRSMRIRRSLLAFVLSFLVLVACTQGDGDAEGGGTTGVPAVAHAIHRSGSGHRGPHRPRRMRRSRPAAPAHVAR